MSTLSMRSHGFLLSPAQYARMIEYIRVDEYPNQQELDNGWMMIHSDPQVVTHLHDAFSQVALHIGHMNELERSTDECPARPCILVAHPDETPQRDFYADATAGRIDTDLGLRPSGLFGPSGPFGSDEWMRELQALLEEQKYRQNRLRESAQQMQESIAQLGKAVEVIDRADPPKRSRKRGGTKRDYNAARDRIIGRAGYC